MANNSGQRSNPLRIRQVHRGNIPQDDMSTIVSSGRYNCYYSLFGDGKKMMTMGRSFDSVDGNTQRSIGTIFEAYGEGKTTGQFTMKLRFRRPGTDGTPTNHISQILG